MRFLPTLFDILTNEQMKTFDGNIAENTPASSHTDHAIWGYVYRIRAVAGSRSAADVSISVKAPVSLTGKTTANLGNEFQRRMGVPDSQITAALRELKAWGFVGIQIGVDYFSASETSTDFFPQYTYDPAVCADWQVTPSETDVRRMLRCAREAELETELRLELWLPPGRDRGSLAPRNVQEWFANYGMLCKSLGQLAQDEGVTIFCLGVEMNSMEQYTEQWRTLVSDVRGVFSGKITFAEGTCQYLFGWPNFSASLWNKKEQGRFWDIFDLIQMNCWDIPLDSSADQHASKMLPSFCLFWREVVDYYQGAYPGKPLVFGEIGTYLFDGHVTGKIVPIAGVNENAVAPLDVQEVTDTWYTFIAGSAALRLDGLTVQQIDVNGSYILNPYTTLEQLPAIRLIRAVLVR
jgi:hypothetical protein